MVTMDSVNWHSAGSNHTCREGYTWSSVTYIGHYISTLYITYIRHYGSFCVLTFKVRELLIFVF